MSQNTTNPAAKIGLDPVQLNATAARILAQIVQSMGPQQLAMAPEELQVWWMDDLRLRLATDTTLSDSKREGMRDVANRIAARLPRTVFTGKG